MANKYAACLESEVPANVRFDVPRRHQGQSLEVAYGGFERAEHCDGAPYKRVHDRSVGPLAVTYYRLVPATTEVRS